MRGKSVLADRANKKAELGLNFPQVRKGPWRGVPLLRSDGTTPGQECPKHKPNLTQRTGAQEVTGGSACWAELAPQGPRHLQEVIRDICKLFGAPSQDVTPQPQQPQLNETRTWSPWTPVRGGELMLGGKWAPSVVAEKLMRSGGASLHSAVTGPRPAGVLHVAGVNLSHPEELFQASP